MSRDRQSSPALQADTHIENDARVEILLFLGIVFWCLLLAICFQESFSKPPGNDLSLYWNGRGLQVMSGEMVNSEKNDKPEVVPAEVTPFLFHPIPVNFSDPQLLATISGIGPGLASQIVKTRDSKGLFRGPQDLLSVPGIGYSRMKQFAPQFSFRLSQ
ncbi:MAG: helix-hairpin-helix domain-containing protein [Pseudomonadota bacterium]